MFGYSNKIVQEDLARIVNSCLPWAQLEGKTVLVTGVNGMLATYVTYTLLYLIEREGLNIKVLALTRNLEKSKALYADFLNKHYFVILHQDICTPIKYQEKVDYIIHLAGNASPYAINQDPVGIVRANLLGTLNVMELARINNCESVLFASTREVYGANMYNILNENSFGWVDPLDNRSCYPESKRAAETIIKSYYNQYAIRGVIVRIAHCYGPGMKLEKDGRVMADFIGNAVNGQDIVLYSSGEAERAFLYISDAIVGLFLLLFKGQAGEAYNLSNEKEPLPIYKVAQMICEEVSEKKIGVVFAKDKPREGYCKYKRVALDNSKIQSLGFSCLMSLQEGIKRTINSF